MAKQNDVTLHGIAEDDALLIFDSDDRLQSVLVIIKTIERKQSTGTGENMKVLFATPVIMTGNPDIMQNLKDVKRGDIVEARGMLTTTNKDRAYQCPSCGLLSQESGVFNYISPIYAEIRERGLSRKEAMEILLNRVEISNRLLVVRNVCAGLEYDDENGEADVPELKYQLAIPRTIKIKEENTESMTDYPWVHSFGKHAIEDRDALRISSRVLIQGHVRTRQVRHHKRCKECGFEYDVDDLPYIEIAPSATEYLSDCILPENENPGIDIAGAAWNLNDK